MSSSNVRSRSLSVRVAILLGACAPVLTACATGFGAPTRHAIANLQAGRATVSSTLQIQDAIIALPNDDTSHVGADAYLEFDAINFGTTPDVLEANLTVDGTATATAGAASSAVASPVAVASRLFPSSSTTVPAATGSSPGTARLVIALLGLQVPLQQGETVDVGMTFEQSGSVGDLKVPVEGAAVVGSAFLPTGPPSIPVASSAAPSVATPVGSAPVGSAPASGEPQSSAVAPAGSSAPAVPSPPAPSPSPASSG